MCCYTYSSAAPPSYCIRALLLRLLVAAAAAARGAAAHVHVSAAAAAASVLLQRIKKSLRLKQLNYRVSGENATVYNLCNSVTFVLLCCPHSEKLHLFSSK